MQQCISPRGSDLLLILPDNPSDELPDQLQFSVIGFFQYF